MEKNSLTSVEDRKRSIWPLVLTIAFLLLGGLFWWNDPLDLRTTASSSPGIISTFRDTMSGYAQGPEMVEVPSGSFVMGSPANERGRFEKEGPERTVTIPNPFAVGKYEVTWDEWEACVADGDCSDNSEKGYSSFDEKSAGDAGYGRGLRPVVNVDWNDAKGYVNWLSRKTGKNYRLLSEAEWEYAARAGTKTAYFWGKNPNGGCGYANGADLDAKEENKYSRWEWITSTCSDGYGKQSAPVGSFFANDFGLHDMHGNVGEWTEDCYRDTYSGSPVDGSADVKGDCAYRIERGGSWGGGPRFFRSAHRESNLINYRIHTLGFRVARDTE